MPAARTLKARAIAWLALREQSRVELRAKLLPHAGSASEVDALLDWLEAHRYLSGERFVESRVRARQERFGRLRIEGELRRHRLSLPVELHQALRESELRRARALHDRRFGPSSPEPGEQARRARFLAGRGFAHDVIARVLRGRPSEEAIDAAA